MDGHWAMSAAARWGPPNAYGRRSGSEPIQLVGTPAQIVRYKCSYILTQMSTVFAVVAIIINFAVYVPRRRSVPQPAFISLELSIPVVCVS